MAISPLGSNVPDEMLCALAAEGDPSTEEQLVIRYSRMVRICARPYFLMGGDSEDLIQEGMLGLLSAIREFRPDEGASFRTYAKVCIKRRLFSAIKAAASGKHTPLNSSISLETPLFDGDADYTLTSIDPLQHSPEELLLDWEAFQERIDRLNGQLSGFEAKILGLYLNGLSYSEIAAEVDRSTKSVDNAVQRVKKKLARQLYSGDFSIG